MGDVKVSRKSKICNNVIKLNSSFIDKINILIENNELKTDNGQLLIQAFNQSF